MAAPEGDGFTVTAGLTEQAAVDLTKEVEMVSPAGFLNSLSGPPDTATICLCSVTCWCCKTASPKSRCLAEAYQYGSIDSASAACMTLPSKCHYFDHDSPCAKHQGLVAEVRLWPCSPPKTLAAFLIDNYSKQMMCADTVATGGGGGDCGWQQSRAGTGCR